jgi:cysteine-rich repeat protein
MVRAPGRVPGHVPPPRRSLLTKHPRAPGLACLILLTSALASPAAAATVSCTASDLCSASANPCTITATRDVGDGCVLDFGARDVVLSGALQSATTSGSFTVRAGSLTLAAGRIRSTGPSGAAGGNVTLEVAGALVLSGSGPTLDVSGAANGGVLTVTAGSIDVRAGSVAADGTGSGACGGAIFLHATTGTLSLAAPVHATGNLFCAGGFMDLSGDDVIVATTLNAGGGDYPGGIQLTANVGDVTITGAGLLKASGDQIELGDGGDGGPLVITAESGDVSIQGALSTDGATPEGEGGEVSIVAGGRVDIAAQISAQGNGGGSDGGSVAVDAGGDVAITANVRVSGGSDAGGGEIDVRSDGVISVATGKLVQASGGSFGGGAITLRDASRIDVAGTLEARGAVGNGGFVTLQACRANVAGTLDTGSGGGGLSGANAIQAGLITVTNTGRLLATPCNSAVSGGCNGLTLTAGTPAIDPLASISPAPTLTIDPSLGSCCGNTTLEPGETCDDGNALGCDGCSHLCQLETTPACPSDGNECTQDCSPTAGCTYAPRHGQTCSDDGNACTADVCSTAAVCTHPIRLCNDGVACTIDSCVAGVGCVATPDDTRCDDAESCTSDSCTGAGCTHQSAPDGVACSDGSLCTTEDTCVGGVCTPQGPPLRCDDDNPCTTDGCFPLMGCNYEEHPELCPCGGSAGPAPAGTTCADGNDCSQGDHCDGAGTCVPGPVCPDDGNACTAETCLQLGTKELCLSMDDACVTDCSAQSNGTPCSDGSACTTGSCQNGSCTAAPVACGDGDPCTGGDYCVSILGCRSGAPPLDEPMCTPSDGLDAFTCYTAKTDRTGPPFGPVFGLPITDRFGSARADVRKHDGLCLPVSVAGDDPTAPVHADKLGGYLVRLRDPLPSAAVRTSVPVHSAFGSVRLDLKKIDGALVPAALDTTTPPGPPVPPDPDFFACYKAMITPGETKFTPLFGIPIVDAFGPLTVDVARPTRLCSPADVNGSDPTAPSHPGQLLCFQVRPSSGTPRFVKRSGVFLGSALGDEKLSVSSLDELCVPATIGP